MPAGAGSAGDTYPGHVLGGWGSGLNFNWEGVFGLNIPNYITISDLGLPLGLGGVPVFEPSFSLPALDAVPVAPATDTGTDIPPQIDRRDVPSDQTDIPPNGDDVALTGLSPNVTTVLWGGEKSSDQLWFEKMFPGQVYNAPNSTILPTSPSTPDAAIVSTEDNVGWISDVYDVVDTSLGGWLPGGVPVGSSIPAALPGWGDTSGGPTTYPPVIANPTVTPMPTNTSPQLIAMGCAPDDPMKGMVYKKFCGTWRWVKVKRRRRRNLVSQSDLRGLAALKGVLGGGKAFEVWIATHS